MSLPSRARSVFTANFPAATEIVRKVKDRYRVFKYGDLYMQAIFSRLYRDNAWGDPESVSGRSSTLSATEALRRELPELLRRLGAESLLDAPCGDFNWMRHVDLGGIAYTGADVVPELVEANRRLHGGPQKSFLHLDVTKNDLPKTDVILCRDLFIHLSFAHAHAAIANFKRSGSQYLLVTTHLSVRGNRDASTGGWRWLNLRLAPFHFPAPLESITENLESGKCLALWRLGEL